MPQAMMNKRSFTVLQSSTGFIGGRYLSVTPYSAARKAAKVLCRAAGGAVSVNFQLRETTSGSTHPTFAYQATAVKINKVRPVLLADGRPLRGADGKPLVIRRRTDIQVTRVFGDRRA
jgi:hypothetical protein